MAELKNILATLRNDTLRQVEYRRRNLILVQVRHMSSHRSVPNATGRLSPDEAKARTAALWTLAALGLLLHNVLHIFSYVAELARTVRDAAPVEMEIFDAGSLWGYAVSLTLVVLPALLSWCGKSKGSAWTALVLGTLLILMHASAGWYHGIHDGASYLAFSATVAMVLPALFAIRSNWRWIGSL